MIEANQSQVPLIILTGDRPPELRDSGANQTIDQVKLYGGYALWSVDMALPEADPDPLLIRYLRTTAARAYATANGLRKGVVHLNMPFRKPLEPTLVETDKTDFPPREDVGAFTSFARSVTLAPSAQWDAFEAKMRRYERGLIVCGPRTPGGDFTRAISLLSQISGYPILADPLAEARFGAHTKSTAVIGGSETFLNGASIEAPDVVIRFGQVPTSKWLNEYLDRAQPEHFIQVGDSGVWADDLHRTTEYIQADPLEFVAALYTDERLSLDFDVAGAVARARIRHMGNDGTGAQFRRRLRRRVRL